MQRLRWMVLLACGFALAPVLAGTAQGPGKEAPANFTGKVVPLADLVAKAGSKLDADAAPHWLAVRTEDGKVYPLVKDAGARAFFKDRALLGRPMRLTGWLLPGSGVLRVLTFQSVVKGEPHEVYYWCEICAIRRSEKMICECCGGPMELREEPVKK